MEGRRASHRWCMCVVYHGYGEFGGSRDGMLAGQSQGDGRMTGDAGARPVCEVETLMSSYHTAFQGAAFGRIEPELVELLGNALTWDATRRLQYFVHAVGWLHFLVLHRCRCCSAPATMNSLQKSQTHPNFLRILNIGSSTYM